jgi:hypothetical protein
MGQYIHHQGHGIFVPLMYEKYYYFCNFSDILIPLLASHFPAHLSQQLMSWLKKPYTLALSLPSAAQCSFKKQ